MKKLCRIVQLLFAVMSICLAMSIPVSAENTTFAEATKIQVNKAYKDNLLNADDVNYYGFILPQDGYITLSFSHGYVGSTNIFWSASFYDNAEKYLVSQKYVGNEKNTLTSTRYGLKAGTYYLKIEKDHWSNVSDAQYNFTVNYTQSDVWESEFNDVFAEADTEPVNTWIYGSLRNSDDIDFYEVNLANDGSFCVSFAHDYVGSTAIFWQMDVYDYNEKYLFTSQFVGNEKNVITTSRTGLPKGTYYLKFTKNHWSNVSDVPYRFSVNYKASDVWEKELNNTFVTSNDISVNKSYHGNLMISDDIDYYHFKLASAGDVTIGFYHDYVESDGWFWVLDLYDYSEKEIKRFIYIGNEKKQVVSEKLNLAAGEYYISVHKNSWSAYSDVPYIFQVSTGTANINPAEESSVTIPTEGTTGLSVGKTASYSGLKYLVTDSSSVQCVGPVNQNITAVVIPATVKLNGKSYNVTSIGSKAFRNRKQITSVKIGSKVTVIGSKAFSGCSGIKKVTIGKNVAAIGASAFYKCSSLTKITIPAKVTSIGKYAFYKDAKLKKLTIKSKLLTTKTVKSKAFKGLPVNAKVNVPNSLIKSYRSLLRKRGLGKKAKVY